MSQTDIDVIRDQYEAVNERDFERAMGHYADDVVLVVPQTEGVADPGTYEGKQAVGRWFGNWFQMFDRDYRFEIHEAREIGDQIFIFATHSGRGRLSGAPVSGANGYLYRVREGKIARVEFYPSRGDALAAAGVPG